MGADHVPAARPARPGRALARGTAGPADHGKTALVLALTGRDTDRLPAEKARGVSIALGFAPLALPSGRGLSLIDVPGHERFVRHMVAGASGIDGFLLCVAADDGVMPQTREHLAVLELLGVRDGVVAVTRADRADPAPAAAAVLPLVAPGTEAVAVCAPAGDGIPELRAALDRLAARLAPRRADGPARLFVDRVFAVAGAGTVVTGTHWGAPIAPGERVTVLPSGATGRVRSVQAHDAPAERADGGRVALALAGVPRDAAPRGSCVVRDEDAWRATAGLGVRLRWLPEAGGDLADGRRLTLFLGTAEVTAACTPLEPARLPPGAEGLVALRLERPVPARPGDRVVLRAGGRARGGGEVIAPTPPRRARGGERTARLRTLADGSPADRDALRLREAGTAGLDPASLGTGAGVVLGGRAFAPDAIAGAREAVRAAAAGGGGVTVAAARAASGLPAAAAAALVDGLVAGGGVALRDPAALGPAEEALAGLLDDAGLRPPTPHDLAREAGMEPPQLRAALGRLRAAGRAAPAGDRWFAAAALEGAADRAREALAERPLGVAELGALWGVGRRGALAIAAHLDERGITVRRGGVRILRRGERPGPGGPPRLQNEPGRVDPAR